jgi:hypothetical protein
VWRSMAPRNSCFRQLETGWASRRGQSSHAGGERWLDLCTPRCFSMPAGTIFVRLVSFPLFGFATMSSPALCFFFIMLSLVQTTR